MKFFKSSIVVLSIAGCLAACTSAPAEEAARQEQKLQTQEAAKSRTVAVASKKDMIGTWAWESDKTETLRFGADSVSLAECPYSSGWMLDKDAVQFFARGYPQPLMPNCNYELADKIFKSNPRMQITGNIGTIVTETGEELKFIRQ